MAKTLASLIAFYRDRAVAAGVPIYAPALAAYNSGREGIEAAIAGGVAALDQLTARKNYVSNVLDLLSCF